MTTATSSTLIEPLRNAATLLLMAVFFGLCACACIGIAGIVWLVIGAAFQMVFS